MANCIPETFSIPVGKKHATVLDTIDVDLAAWRWYPKKASSGSIYAQRNISRWRGKDIDEANERLLHRIILERKLGRRLIEGERPDHINGDRLDNRRANIRLATRSQNAQNVSKHKDNKSGYKGVHWAAGREKWCAMIMANGKRYNLGYFTTAEIAYQAYCEAARRLHGEFARLE